MISVNKIKAAYQLLKPGLALSIVITTVPALFLGPRIPGAGIMLSTLAGTGFLAMAAFAYNQLLESHIDARMERTKYRVLPTGLLSDQAVHLIGTTFLGTGIIVLGLNVNLLAASIGFFSFFYYVFIYTMILKPRTDQNTVLGGIAGAIGPLIGEAAAAGRISIAGAFLFLLLFLWQPAHFWALAIFRRDDYARAGIPMLPVTRGIPLTINYMIMYQFLLIVFIGLAFYPLQLGSLLFLFPSAIAGIFILYLMFRLKADYSDRKARSIFFLTILHMIVWHGTIAIDLFMMHV